MDPVNFSVIENNDLTVRFHLKADGVAADLTGATVELYVKDSAAIADSEASKYTVANLGLEIAAPTTGVVEVHFKGGDLVKKKRVYHLDVIKTGKRLTYAYGNITVVQV